MSGCQTREENAAELARDADRPKARFLVIVWPEGHDEDLATAAEDIQDMLDAAQVGGARVVAPIPDAVNAMLEDVPMIANAC